MVFQRDKLAQAGGRGKVKAGHILLVDDEPDNLKVIEDLLGDEYHCTRRRARWRG